LIALPSLLACLFVNNQRYSSEQVQAMVASFYPYLQAELFLHWNSSELSSEVQRWLDALVDCGYLHLNDKGYHATPASSNEYALLEGLAANVMQTLERYFLTLSVLSRKGSGELSAKELEEQCTLLAQRISLLYGINAPEFFDKSLFRTLIQQLLKQGVLQHNDDQLCHSDQLEPLAQMLEELLDGGLRQSILRSLV